MDTKEERTIAAAVQKYLRDPQIPEGVRSGRETACVYLWGTGNQFLKDYMATGNVAARNNAAECLEAAKLDFRQHRHPVLRSLYATILSDLGIVLAETGQTGEAKKCFNEALAVATDAQDSNLIRNIQDNISLLAKRGR